MSVKGTAREVLDNDGLHSEYLATWSIPPAQHQRFAAASGWCANAIWAALALRL